MNPKVCLDRNDPLLRYNVLFAAPLKIGVLEILLVVAAAAREDRDVTTSRRRCRLVRGPESHIFSDKPFKNAEGRYVPPCVFSG